jgi:dipeptidyl aminopeptidase/acylaminoacyl peptidase
MQMTTETASYGEWRSPIASADIARKRVGLAFPTVIGSRVWWQETRPSEGGRVAVVCQEPDGGSRDLLPVPWNARTRVHEYGGRSYLPVPGGLVFANFADQRLYLAADRAGSAGPRPLTPAADAGAAGPRPLTPAADAGAAGPRPLTPAADAGAADRFADFVLSPAGDEVWCVRERHSASRDGDGPVSRAIVAVPLDGSAADAPGAVRVLVSGSDFYAFPAPSPDGTRLAWICWDHPRMPWDGTELRVGTLGDAVRDQQVIMGGLSESVLGPVWRDDRSIYAISDRSGWWNLYLSDLQGQPRALCPLEEEFAGPLWQLGMYPYGVLDDGRIAVTHGTGEQQLGLLDPDTGKLTDLDLPYRVFTQGVSASGRTVAVIAGAPAVPLSVAVVEVPAEPSRPAEARELRRESDLVPDPGYLPVPRESVLTGPSGSVVHAFVYPPTNPRFRAPDGELPPYIVWVHGGPTAQVTPRFDLEKAFFTSRGIGIIDVNYGGSSGYGRAYRERLRGQWGVVDVTDVMAAALALAQAGEADGKRLGIRGGSAGGWTALASVTSGLSLDGHGPRRRGVFAAATSYFGVSDLREFAAQTHDFESRYLDGLIGPLPECERLYAERAPVGHVDGGTCPVLLLQGLDDPIVPPGQSESIAADLAAQGIPHAYLAFAGESHGFRKAENIAASLEAELSFYGQIMDFTPPGIPPVALS